MTGQKLTSVCPTCNEESECVFEWEYGGLNDSVFNYTAKYYECRHCGLLYVNNITDQQLSVFYEQECSYFEKAHFDITSPENVEKYKSYRNVILEAGLSDMPVTDIGCGRAGFLIWMRQNLWNAECTGVDIDLKSFPGSVPCDGLSLLEGRAVALPFAEATQSLLTYFHVFEHIRDIDRVLSEAFRVLKDSAHILIEVPDAERYQDYPIGSAFWLGIREHIYHFSADSLCSAFYRHGFDVVEVIRQVLPTPEFLYPSLMILAKKGSSAQRVRPERLGDISAYAVRAKKELEIQVSNVLKIRDAYSHITFWGCSSELFSVLPMLPFHDFSLCDSSKIKQQGSYRGIAIQDPALIQKRGALIVAPYLYSNAIKQAAISLGWSEKDIFCLQ